VPAGPNDERDARPSQCFGSPYLPSRTQWMLGQVLRLLLHSAFRSKRCSAYRGGWAGLYRLISAATATNVSRRPEGLARPRESQFNGSARDIDVIVRGRVGGKCGSNRPCRETACRGMKRRSTWRASTASGEGQIRRAEALGRPGVLFVVLARLAPGTLTAAERSGCGRLEPTLKALGMAG